MLLPSMRRYQEWMAFLIVQDDQRTAPQHLFQAPHQPTGNQVICVDGFAVPIDVKNRNRTDCQMWSRLPERSCPVCQGLSEGLICPRFRQLCQKSLGVAIAVGKTATREDGQSLAAVALSRPAFAAVPLLPERATSTTDCAVSWVDCGPGATMG